MAFIFGEDMPDEARSDLSLFYAQYAAYQEYLESIRTELPQSAYQFATAEWHYNPQRHECPHDAWVESLTILEPFSGEHRQRRSLEIRLKLLGAYHDGHIYLEYKNIQSYELRTPAEFVSLPLGVGHGDWLVDEIRLSERNLVLHEIEFSRGSRWLIECKDITFQWDPLA